MSNYKITNKDTVIFDFDGTLVDSMDVFANIAAEIMPKHYPINFDTARAMYMETSGLPFFQQLESLFPNHKANAKASEEFESTKLEGYYDRPLFTDTVDTLKHLRTNGMKVVVSSNNFQELVDAFVEKAGMEMDLVLGFKPGFAKGADHFKYIEQTLNTNKQQMLFVGDSMKDAEKARDFGLDFVGKEGVFTRAEFTKVFPDMNTIATLSELKAITQGG
jgi:phosphoglycolate phosphatase